MYKKTFDSVLHRVVYLGEKNYRAFTLAEVLITLGIIGLVAALTLPSLIQSYKEKIYSAQLKKAYSLVADAAKQVVIDENATETIVETDAGEAIEPGFYTSDAGLSNSSSTTGAEYFLSKYIKHSKSGTVSNGIMASSYSTPDGTDLGTVPTGGFCVKTPSGAGICMRFDESAQVAKVYIDSNGPEDPNESGVDLFVMKINNNSEVSDIVDDETKCNVSSAGTNTLEKYAGGCLQKVMLSGWKVEE